MAPAFCARRAAIVGIGAMGGSLGLALKARGLAGEVWGVARTEATLAGARAVGAVDHATAEVEEAVCGADLVVLATPVRAAIALLPRVAAALRQDCLVTDVGSTKKEFCEAARAALPAGALFVGGHPMAGLEVSGAGAARGDLFEGSMWVLTPEPDTAMEAMSRAVALARAVGANVLELSPADHDEMVAAVSHLPHLVATALVGVVAARAQVRPEVARLAASGFRDLTRIASGDPVMWRDIVLTNRAAIARVAGEMIEELTRLRALTEAADAAELEQLFDRARKARNNMG
jgi:prephenate dehydrogenase